MSRVNTRREQSRGRPSRRLSLYHPILKSILLISSKHNLDPQLLVEAFIEAIQNRTARCGSLRIECRQRNKDSATVLVTKQSQVVWQFPIKHEILRNPQHLKNRLRATSSPTPAKPPNSITIDRLKSRMRGINIKAKVIEVPQSRSVLTRLGTTAMVSNVLIGDDTGRIRISLWNNQIDKVHVGDEVKLENCYVANYLGQPQLRLGRKGTISVT